MTLKVVRHHRFITRLPPGQSKSVYSALGAKLLIQAFCGLRQGDSSEVRTVTGPSRAAAGVTVRRALDV